jgi:hypothetical protein
LSGVPRDISGAVTGADFAGRLKPDVGLAVNLYDFVVRDPANEVSHIWEASSRLGYLLHIGPLVGRYLFPAVIPPPLSVVA